MENKHGKQRSRKEMLELSREECIRAKNRLRCMAYRWCDCEEENIYEVNYHDRTLEQLIEEHFDNPPLEFEELHEGMWVWDSKFVNEHNLYVPTMVYITKVEMCHWGYSIRKYPTVEFKTVIKSLYGFFSTVKFEPNRFYHYYDHEWLKQQMELEETKKEGL